MSIFLHEWLEIFIQKHHMDVSDSRISELYSDAVRRAEDHQEYAPMTTYDECQCYTLQEFIDKNIKPNDMIYDRSTGMVVVNMRRALHTTLHEWFVGHLDRVIENIPFDCDWDYEVAAEHFSIHHGFFLSSVGYSRAVYIGKDTKLSAIEKKAFGSYNIIKEF